MIRNFFLMLSSMLCGVDEKFCVRRVINIKLFLNLKWKKMATAHRWDKRSLKPTL